MNEWIDGNGIIWRQEMGGVPHAVGSTTPPTMQDTRSRQTTTGMGGAIGGAALGVMASAVAGILARRSAQRAEESHAQDEWCGHCGTHVSCHMDLDGVLYCPGAEY